jgi:hypothetical protein
MIILLFLKLAHAIGGSGKASPSSLVVDSQLVSSKLDHYFNKSIRLVWIISPALNR